MRQHKRKVRRGVILGKRSTISPNLKKASTISAERENVSGLCTRCWAMTTDPQSHDYLFSGSMESQRTLSEVKKSGSEGCPLCSVTEDFQGSTEYTIKFKAVFKEDVTSQCLTEVIMSCSELSAKCLLPGIPVEKFHVCTAADSHLSQFIQQRPVETHASSPTTIAAIRKCVQDCLSQHPKCQRRNSPLLPTRVLFVGENGANTSYEENSNSILKLHVSSNHQRSEYVALSYSWGGPQRIVTSRATLTSHKERLDMDKLPQTIQDAINVTRSLGIKYLWIDALCILQDEASDMSNEIRLMGEIYKNSTITISAARSRGAEDGFLKEYPNRSIESRLHIANLSGKIWFVPETSHNTGEEPLAMRGWAFQEQILSPRLLHYGTIGINWVCTSESHLEIPPHYAVYTGSLTENGVAIQSFQQTLSQPRSDYAQENSAASVDNGGTEAVLDLKNMSLKPPFPPSNSHDLWIRLVIDFCNRNLTFGGDRLRAIAGVASEIHKLYPDTYIAGLWQQNLVKSLCWMRDIQHSRRYIRSSGNCDVPSWSWASINAPIRFDPPQECDARFIRSFVRPITPISPFGDVSGKRLVLSARMSQVHGSTLPGRHFFQLFLDRPLQSGEWENFPIKPSGLMEVEHDPELCWYVLLGYGRGRILIGLVLKEQNERVFVRIGYFNTSKDDMSRASYPNGEEELERKEDLAEKWERSEVEIV